MQTLRVTYRAWTIDGEVTETCALEVDRMFVRTIIEAFSEYYDEIRVTGPVYSSAFCLKAFFQAVKSIVYLKGYRFMSIQSVSAEQPAETA